MSDARTQLAARAKLPHTPKKCTKIYNLLEVVKNGAAVLGRIRAVDGRIRRTKDAVSRSMDAVERLNASLELLANKGQKSTSAVVSLSARTTEIGSFADDSPADQDQSSRS